MDEQLVLISSVGIALGYGLDDRGSRVRFPGGGLEVFLFTTAFRTVLGPTQPPIQWVARALSLGLKRVGRDADHSPPSSAEIKECVELYLQYPNTSSWRGAKLKHRDNFTFTFTSSHTSSRSVNQTNDSVDWSVIQPIIQWISLPTAGLRSLLNQLTSGIKYKRGNWTLETTVDG
jgi:hypothetical protein